MKKRNPITENRAYRARMQLFELSRKIRGIGYLFEQQSHDECPPFNLPEIYEGIGLLLQSLGEEAREIWSILDQWEIDREKK